MRCWPTRIGCTKRTVRRKFISQHGRRQAGDRRIALDIADTDLHLRSHVVNFVQRCAYRLNFVNQHITLRGDALKQTSALEVHFIQPAYHGPRSL